MNARKVGQHFDKTLKTEGLKQGNKTYKLKFFKFENKNVENISFSCEESREKVCN